MPLPSWLKSGYFPKYVHPFDSITELNIYMEKNVQICIPTNNSFCFANKYLLNSVNSPNICTVVLLIGNMTWHLRMTIIERYHRSLYIKHLWHTKGTLKATVRKPFVWGLTSLFSSTSSYYTPIKKDHSNPLPTEGGETGKHQPTVKLTYLRGKSWYFAHQNWLRLHISSYFLLFKTAKVFNCWSS